MSKQTVEEGGELHLIFVSEVPLKRKKKKNGTSEQEDMTSKATSSFTSSAFYPKKYDVFISFRGEDTRSKFVSHLFTALRDKSIITYIDYRLGKGDEISPMLLKAIENSSVSVVVFSKNYALSEWCLEELTKILECRKDQGQVVIPVFYEVHPSHVRKQTESYKEAFTKHEGDLKNNSDKVHKWKDALTQATNLVGWDSRSCGDESRLIQNIVNDVLQKVHHMYPIELEGLVGADENCRCVELALENAAVVGIWGMGGMGKTTIAKAVFAKLFPQYEGWCFLENIREESEKHGLKYLRDKLLYELLKEEPEVVPSTFLSRRLRSKKNLIVLDDLNEVKQLDYLTNKFAYLHPGSKVIITTRDKHLLIGRVNEIYRIKELSFQDSLKLFSRSAFGESHPKIDYEELSKRAVDYTNKLPLALKVLGSNFNSKSRDKWESALKKFKKHLNADIQNTLKLSYDDLDNLEKEIFLDVAFFCKGEKKDDVVKLLDACDFYADSGIDRLVDKALITISYNNTIQMHDLIQEMGWDIVRQESFKYPERRSRLRDTEEIYDILKNNMGNDTIEGIILNLSQSRDLHLSFDTFKKMTRLRFLKFYCFDHGKICNVYLPSDLEFSNKLRYLEWYGYPLGSLPSTFCLEKLVELHMPNSQVKKLWNGVQDLVNLKKITLRGSKQLMELPDFSKASNLESMNLSQCERLCDVHPSILSLPKLVYMDLCNCTMIENHERQVRATFHRPINVIWHSSLKQFSVSSEEIIDLDLFGTRFEISNFSIGRFNNCYSLSMKSLGLHSLPKELFCLTNIECLFLYTIGEAIDKMKLQILIDASRSLKILHAAGCRNFSELPDNISFLSALRDLNLDQTSVESLPSSIKLLSQLKRISLWDCRRLRSIPELPPTIRLLNAGNCKSLEAVQFTSPAQRQRSSEARFAYFLFENCLKLNEHSLRAIMELAQYELKLAAYKGLSKSREDATVTVCLPGSNVPEWFPYRRTEACLAIEFAVPSQSHLLGFVLCIVHPQAPSNVLCRAEIRFKYCLENGETGSAKLMLSTKSITELNMNNVLLWYDSEYCDAILKKIRESRKSAECTTHKLKVSFEFIVEYDVEHKLKDMVIRECGVCPIYVSEYSNIFKQMGLESEVELGPVRANEMGVGSFNDKTDGSEKQKSKEFIFPPMPTGTSWKNATRGFKDIFFL